VHVCLGDDQPVYAFHAVGTDASETPRPRTIEEIAEIYEAELDQVLPRGPVVLGGFTRWIGLSLRASPTA